MGLHRAGVFPTIAFAVAAATGHAGAGEVADACDASGLQRCVGGPETSLHRIKLTHPVLVIRRGVNPASRPVPIRRLVRVDPAGFIAGGVCG